MGNTQFNQPIKEWDVSSVTDMFGMFAYSQFNQPIEEWDISSVSSMTKMFAYSQFNQADILPKWDMDGKESHNVFKGSALQEAFTTSITSSNIGKLGLSLQ